MGLKSAESKVTSTAGKLGKAVGPITTIMSAARLPMQAAQSGGFAGVYDFYAGTVIPNWAPPGWGEFRSFIQGPGGASIMTGIGVGLVKWLVGEVAGAAPGSQSKEVAAINMILDAVGDAASGTAIGEAASMIIHGPTYSGGAGGGAGFLNAGVDSFRGEPKQNTLARKRGEKAITAWPVFS
ncbi:unnamed protein product [marine sediment metagenome]|uniref:Uncharacterized protein n=1 Tax=marine sediment metagenome TaxID=412755 RepID=X0SU25_9ZZZZ